MNSYKRERDIPPFLMGRDDLDALWSKLLALLPSGDAQLEWHSVASDLDRVQVDEPNLTAFLENPELPETLSSLVVAVHKNFDRAQPNNTYSIRLSLQKRWANITVSGPDEAWAIGVLEQVNEFFLARRRRFGQFMRVLNRIGLIVVMLPAGALFAVAFGAILEGNDQVATLALISVLALALTGALFLTAKGGDVTRVRLAGSARSWSATFVVTVVACGFSILTFVVAVLQLLKS